MVFHTGCADAEVVHFVEHLQPIRVLRFSLSAYCLLTFPEEPCVRAVLINMNVS